MKLIRLDELLNKQQVNPNTVIKWAYYAYGFLSVSGECKRKELPVQVKYAKCFDVTNDVYCVDGAL